MARKMKSSRSMKVCEASGYKYKPVPSIVLKGQWLGDLGFEAGDAVSVECRQGVLTITKAAAAEEALMVAEEKGAYR